MGDEKTRDWHDHLRSGWTIVAFAAMVGGAGAWVGRITASLEQRAPVEVRLPAELRTELNACRALAYVVDQRRRRERSD